MIVPSVHVPDAKVVLRYTNSVTKKDTYVARPQNVTEREKVAMLTELAGLMGLQVAIQHFPDLSQEAE